MEQWNIHLEAGERFTRGLLAEMRRKKTCLFCIQNHVCSSWIQDLFWVQSPLFQWEDWDMVRSYEPCGIFVNPSALGLFKSPKQSNISLVGPPGKSAQLYSGAGGKKTFDVLKKIIPGFLDSSDKSWFVHGKSRMTEIGIHLGILNRPCCHLSACLDRPCF